MSPRVHSHRTLPDESRRYRSLLIDGNLVASLVLARGQWRLHANYHNLGADELALVLAEVQRLNAEEEENDEQ